jgi:osmotically-inducible protein OsmY
MLMHHLRLTLVICTTAAVALAAPAANVPARPAARAQARRAAPRLDDREIESAIRARLARSKIATDKFQVRVQGGIATLEGNTEVVQHKGTATRLAKAGGAREVVNRIQISAAARQRAAANLTKGRRRAQIKRGELRSERR